MSNCKILVLALVFITAGSCKDAIRGTARKAEPGPEQDTIEATPHRNATDRKVVTGVADLPGDWVGMFEPAWDSGAENTHILTGEVLGWDYANKINLSIDSINGATVVGHSVVAGNARPFRGSVKKERNNFVFTVAEPGDNQYDGQFAFSIAIGDSSLSGTWTASRKLKVSKREYTLKKVNYRYNPEQQLEPGHPYIDWLRTRKTMLEREGEEYLGETYFTTTNDVYRVNASAAKLNREEVANMTKADLFIIRQAIYARHGYSFRNRQLRAYFDMQSWYIPLHVNIKTALTPIEKENISLLLKFEKHAEEYYDEFGRG